MNLFDVVVLTIDLPDDGLWHGARGTIVDIHNGGAAYEVEFVSPEGATIALVTLDSSEIAASRLL